jgi:protocatechuate 3,4-dioxygenase beta subunit
VEPPVSPLVLPTGVPPGNADPATGLSDLQGSPATLDGMSRHDHDDAHDLGLAHDLPRLLSRRRALGTLLAGGAGAFLAACGSDEAAAPSASTATSTGSDATSAINEETAGPFPGDGSNGPNVLAESGVVRRDITSSFGGASGKADGVPTTIELTLIDVAGGGGPLAGAAVYAWHCDREGRYSLYDATIADQNYLRGVQVSDAAGKLAFDTVFPAAYSGRWPHVHFEVYESLAAATAGSGKLRTSQLAIPKEACEQVYGSADGYGQSVQNLAQTSLDSDMVFSDGYAGQLATASGTVGDGYRLALNVGV